VHSKVGSEGGKLTLNVEAKRHPVGALRHAHTRPELRLYSPFGPHNSPTRMGGTFALRQMLPSIFSEPDQVGFSRTRSFCRSGEVRSGLCLSRSFNLPF
jgi:hypothetical protein